MSKDVPGLTARPQAGPAHVTLLVTDLPPHELVEGQHGGAGGDESGDDGLSGPDAAVFRPRQGVYGVGPMSIFQRGCDPTGQESTEAGADPHVLLTFLSS